MKTNQRMVMISVHDKSSLTQKNCALCEVRTDTEETIVVIDINYVTCDVGAVFKETADHKQSNVIDCKHRVSTFKKCRS
jgi:hypothetical protein